MSTKSNNVHVLSAVDRLKNLTPVTSGTKEIASVQTDTIEKVTAPTAEQPAAATPARRQRRAENNVDNKAAMLRATPPKDLVYLQEKKYAKMGRPTQKQGDLKTDYVKISPAIPRSVKDRLDDALPGLKRDPSSGVLTMEDVVTKAIDAYLAARGK